MNIAVKAVEGKIIITSVKSTIMQYAGKLHERYNKKKINVDKIRDVIVYSDL